MTILILEDDRYLMELIQIYLEGAGYKVLGALDMDSGLALAAAHGTLLHLVVSDVSLPGASPEKAAELAAFLEAPARFLYISGHSRATIEADRIPLATAEVLEKPFSERGLLDRVNAILLA